MHTNSISDSHTFPLTHAMSSLSLFSHTLCTSLLSLTLLLFLVFSIIYASLLSSLFHLPLSHFFFLHLPARFLFSYSPLCPSVSMFHLFFGTCFLFSLFYMSISFPVICLFLFLSFSHCPVLTGVDKCEESVAGLLFCLLPRFFDHVPRELRHTSLSTLQKREQGEAT